MIVGLECIALGFFARLLVTEYVVCTNGKIVYSPIAPCKLKSGLNSYCVR